jgi:hypothetical protein
MASQKGWRAIVAGGPAFQAGKPCRRTSFAGRAARPANLSNELCWQASENGRSLSLSGLRSWQTGAWKASDTGGPERMADQHGCWADEGGKAAMLGRAAMLVRRWG